METFHNGDLTFDVRDCGGAGEAVVLLHGFPQDSTAWVDVVPPLQAAGLRTLAPDLRGYSPRARPRGRRAYRVDVLATDVLALLDQADLDGAHVVGHDWGGFLAWYLAAHHPDRVRTLTVLSTPHPAALQWAMRHGDQARRSWYMAAFQLPVLPEAVIGTGLRRRGAGALGLPPAQAEAYAERMLQPGALRTMINWYRAIPTRPPLPVGPVEVPVSYLWGRGDRYLGRAAAHRTARHCSADYRFVELDCDHWLPEREPQVVARHVLERIGR